MEVFVNSEPRQVAEGITVAQLLEQLGLKSKYVAVEVNLRVVPRSRHAEHRLSAGDRLEVVTLVGGG
ncbi:MAG: sulfur carrier protein ThiS [Thermoguttaceae bacterium]